MICKNNFVKREPNQEFWVVAAAIMLVIGAGKAVLAA
jgi:1,2-phenylacetyl-CoA epoxidase PaaB subunit